MWKRQAALVSSLLLLSLQPAAAAQKVSEFWLENGLQVVVIEDHRAPAVSQLLWYRAGGSDGPPGKSGIAHFVEHLMFEGTENVPPGEFRRTVQELGGSDNAFTSLDYTAYVQRIASDRLDRVMELEADRMRGLVMTDEAIETERMIVLEERSERTDSNPGSLFREQRSAALYLNHPYSIPVIGWRHEIENLSREDIFNFYRRFYAPNNATLIIAGDVQPEEALRLAKEHYGPIAAEPQLQVRARPEEPPHLAARRLVFKDERVAQPYMIRTYLAQERDPGDQRTAAALVMLESILSGDGINSYLKRRLEVEDKVSIYSDAFYTATSLDTTSFGMVVLPAEDVSLQETETALDEALAGFFEEGIDEEQLARLKKSARAAWIYEQDNVRDVAFRYGRALTAGLTIDDIAEWPDILQSVTPEEIMAAAAEVFKIEWSVTGWLMSKEEET